ncbi:thioredoxin family protein [Pedobacter frigiditerrae]|uniref:thioredoxin family protein n=1 Tax=Pedobacter frigiditerrae TaxID=2530452 RepID=UPI00292EA7F2|nr:thioredoxin family protein [Pedobacter frigiditerrae]
MKNLLTSLILLFAMNASAQELNKKIEDPNRHKQVMLNLCTREGITSFPEFKESYDPNYAAYKPDSTAFADLSKLIKGKKITIVLGTWCGDSKYQVPHFLKIMDGLKIDEDKITIIGVDGAKHAENGLIDSLKITNVPTFIFFDKKGKEVGRITEHPKETLEKDMLKILAVTKKTKAAKTETKTK